MKIKRMFLSVLVIFSFFCLVSCTKKSNEKTETNKPVDPQITVSIEDRRYIVGEKLGDIELRLSNNQIGSVQWENEEYVLQFGNNICRWNFTPTNSEEYNSKSGTITIVGAKALIKPTVTDVQIKEGFTAYNEALFSTIELECFSNTPGTIAIVNYNNVFVLGNNTCNWIFTPDDTEDYESISGSVVIVVTENQFLTSISVKSNTKNSGYIAFDEFDCSGLTLNLTYNAGKTLSVSSVENDCLVDYLTGDCLHQGDTKVTITYQEKTCDVVIEKVGYKEIDKPTFEDDIVYDGTEKKLKIAESTLYTFEPIYKIDAGVYDLSVTLVDSNNYKWKDSDNKTIAVSCLIKKTEQEVTEVNYVGEYDGDCHSPYVESLDAATIYYSESELTIENYSSASAEQLNIFKNAGSYTVYYYSVGDNNHKDCSGTLSVSISKQTPKMNLVDNCYTLKTGNAVAYPIEFVELIDKQEVVLENNNLTFTYYTSYTNNDDPIDDIKTTSADGSETVGGAPINDRTTVYYVVVEYAGDGLNYEKTSSIAKMFIDKQDNGFFDTTGENKFVFKDDIKTYSYLDGAYITTGSEQECTCYLEFEALEINQYGFIEVEVISKFASGNDNVKIGKLTYKDGKYQIVFDDETLALTANGDVSVLTVTINEETKQLQKWVLPSYLKTYQAKTVKDENFNNTIHTSQNTTLTIYNDYGTIRFTLDLNVKIIPPGIFSPAGGGHEFLSGVVETRFIFDSDNGNKTTCKLRMYIIGDDVYRTPETSQRHFAVKWCVVNSMEPSSVVLFEEGYPPFNDVAYEDITFIYYDAI